jgi:hypothetical protein
MDEYLKLIEIYKKTSNFFYNNKINVDQKSKHWERRYNPLEINLDNLVNFRKDRKLSHGLDDGKKDFSFKIYTDIINELSEEYVLKNLPKKNIGNNDILINYKDVYIDFNKLIHIHWFHTIENKILKQNKISNVCEIGGGFGSFSELFLKNYNTRLLFIDLPEANLMASYYFKELHPQKKFYLFDDYLKNEILTYEDFNKNDIIILPPNCNIDEKIKIDFFANSRSMMEMNHSVIKSYFDFIHKYSHEKTFFLNINRYEKTSMGFPIRISEYPYDSYWKVIISKPSFNQNWIHFLLTQRTLEINKANIFKELNNIKKIGCKFYRNQSEYRPKYIMLKKTFRKILRIFLGVKFLNIFGNFLFKIGNILKNFK